MPAAPAADLGVPPVREHAQARAGVVVGKRVGNAVQRNLVKRRLREHLRNHLPALPEGSLVVVRALPGAGSADHQALGRALDGALRAVTERRVDA
jgi:ribonuclease P protein component